MVSREIGARTTRLGLDRAGTVGDFLAMIRAQAEYLLLTFLSSGRGFDRLTTELAGLSSRSARAGEDVREALAEVVNTGRMPVDLKVMIEASIAKIAASKPQIDDDTRPLGAPFEAATVRRDHQDNVPPSTSDGVVTPVSRSTTAVLARPAPGATSAGRPGGDGRSAGIHAAGGDEEAMRAQRVANLVEVALRRMGRAG